MSLRLKDLIREFVPERKAEAAPTPDLEPMAAEAPSDPVSGLMAEILDAIDAVCAVLNDETAAMNGGELGQLEGFARRKHAVAERLERMMGQLDKEGLVLTDELRAIMLARVEELDRSIAYNTAGLVAMRKAVLSINRSLLAALEKEASDGLYSPGGQAVRPVELSASGLDREL